MTDGTAKKLTNSSNMTLTAVALQDHWSRSISLGTKFGPRKIGLGPAARAKQKPEAKSVIDTGRNKGRMRPGLKEKEKENEKEFVLDKQPPPLTLAQKFGLVNAPKPLLSETEWKDVKAKSNKREDSGEPCVICKEDFGLEEQVLLSCTHVFHRACLQAFERFTGRKTCPMCRHEQYQTRVIHEGAKIHRYKSAIKIQAAWRGYVVHSWYKNLRATVPPKDPMLRKKFYEEKLSSIVDRMVKSLDMNMAAFLRELDDSVKQSREIFDQWDASHMTITPEEWEEIQLKAIERGAEDCPICLTELCHYEDPNLHHGERLDSGRKDNKGEPNPIQQTSNANSKHSSSSKNNTLAPKKNAELRRKAADKKLFQKLYLASEGANRLPEVDGAYANQASENGRNSQQGNKPSNNGHIASGSAVRDRHHKTRSTVLLSCSHVFHSTCLSTLEEMAMIDMRNTCPVCRAHYQKKVIVF